MCTGLEIAGLIGGPLLSAVGAGIQQNEMQKQAEDQANARNKVLQATMDKNQKLADESRAAFDAREQQIAPDQVQQQQQQLTKNRQDTLEQAASNAPAQIADVSLSGSAPDVVKSALANRLGDVLNQSTNQAKNLGTLSGYGDTFFNQGLADTNASRQLGQDANFVSGNMAIMPALQDIAQERATKPISPIGGILSGFGSALSSYAGGGGYLPKKTYTSPYI